MSSVPSAAVPRMLQWARTTAGFALDEAANAERIRPEALAEWENGHGTPSLAVLGRLAKRYKRPLMVFYLPEPPTDFTVVRDFRLLPASVGQAMSPKLRRTIRLIRERQAWASNFIQDGGDLPCNLVASITPRANVIETAHQLRNRLGVSMDEQVACKTASAAFSLWRSRCEQQGVFVFQASGLKVVEMRGCAFSEKYAPVVVVNLRDSFSARTFTLIHEMVHILLGLSSLSAVSDRPPRAIERFCNRVAAEVLMPTKDFRQRIPHNWQDNDDSVIANVARQYRVSRLAVLLKLADERLASPEYVNEKWKLFCGPSALTKSGPVPEHKKALNRTGEMFARLALSAYHAGEIHGAALTELLGGMKLRHLPKMIKVLYPTCLQAAD